MEFIDEINDRDAYEVWLHKVFDQSFDEFKQKLKEHNRVVTDEELETTISDSKNILSNFVPNN